MKLFILITSLIASFSAHGINQSQAIPDQSSDQNLINKIDPKTFIKPMEMAGNINPDSSSVQSTTCDKCGTPVDASATFCPSCGDKVDRCPHCGADNPEDATSCRSCHKSLASVAAEASTTCSKCGNSQPDGKKFCNNCGQPMSSSCGNCNEPMKAGSKFCGNCGTAVGGDE